MYRASPRVNIGLSLNYANTKVPKRRFARKGLIWQSDYFLMLRPVLWMGIIFGRIPCSAKSGWIRYGYKSVPFIYAVTLACANWICNGYYHQRISSAMYEMLGSSVSFSNVLFSFLIFIQPLTTLIMVYSWFLEVPAIVNCFNKTAILEKKISGVVRKNLRKPRITRLVTFSITLFLISDFAIACVLLMFRYGNEYPLLVLLLVIMNVVVNYSHTILWCLNFYFISYFAVTLRRHMISCLQVKENCALKLKICRRTWISIWRQSQNYSHSVAITIGFTLITNGTIFVVGCYGLIASLQNSSVIGILEMSPYVLITLVVIACIFELPYQATNKLGNAFLNTMAILDRNAIDQSCIEEIDRFVDTIHQTRIAVITLKDYMTMDRTLVISFLSYSMTYLIVLLQVNGSGDSPSSFQMGNSTYSE